MKLRLFIFCGILHFGICAQHPYFYTIGYEQGIPSSEIYIIAQDTFGAIWIGCDAGLYRYNGHAFQEIYQPERKGSISNIQIVNGKNIYCQNFNGQIFHCDMFDDSLKLFFDASPYSSKFPEFISDDFGLYVLTDQEIFFKAHHTDAMRSIYKTSTSDLHLISLAHSNSDNLVCIDQKGIYRQINKISGLVNFTKHVNHKHTIFRFHQESKSPFLLAEHADQTGNHYSIYQVDTSGELIFLKRKRFENHKILNIKSESNELFFGTTNGVYIEKLDGKKDESAHYFARKKVSSHCIDREGNLFFSTLDNGILVIPNRHIRYFDESHLGGFNPHITFLMLHQNKHLLLGNYGGSVCSMPLLEKQSPTPYFPDGTYRAVQYMMVHQEKTWVARGALELYADNKRIQSFPQLQNVRAMTPVENKVAVISSSRFATVDEHYNVNILREKGGKDLCYFKGVLYGLFSDGLFYFKDNQWFEMKINGKTVYGNSLAQWRNKMFVGTDNLGIYTFDGISWSPDLVSEMSGASLEILKLVVQENMLLAASRNYFMCIDLQNNHKEIWNKYDGFALPEINSMVLYENLIFIGTINGLVQIQRDQNITLKTKPSLRLVSIFVNDKPVDSLNINKLDYYENTIAWEFEAIDLRSRGNLNFSYRLSGLEKNWNVISGNQRIIRYNELPPGTYRFEVRAINERGLQSALLSIPLKIAAPFWKSLWFVVLIFCVFGLAIILFFKIRVQQIQKKHLFKQQILGAQIKAIKAQMNPHFLFNTLNSLQDLILQKDFKQTNYYLVKFGNLMRDILQASDRESILLSEEIRMLNDYLELEKLRFGTDFTFSITCNEELFSEDPKFPPLLLQPYVENAVKHGLLHKKGSKILAVSFENLNDSIRVVISDNGVGREKAAAIGIRQKHKSFSNDANEKRLELMKNYHGRVYKVEIHDLYDANLPVGTRIELLLSKLDS